MLHDHRRAERLWPEQEGVWPVNPAQPMQSHHWSARQDPLENRFQSAEHQTTRDARPLDAAADLNRNGRFPDQSDPARIWEAFNRNRHSPSAFAAAFDENGILLASVTKQEADRSHRQAAFAKELNRFSPRYQENEIVAVTPGADIYRLDQRTTGADRKDIERLLKKIDRTQLPSLEEANKIMRERAEARQATAQLMGVLFPRNQPDLEPALGNHLRHVTRDIRDAASSGSHTVERAGGTVGTLFEFGAGVLESLFGRTLTPAQKRAGQLAERERQLAANLAETERREIFRDR